MTDAEKYKSSSGSIGWVMTENDCAHHKDWIKTLADLQGGRPFFSDQTAASLYVIGRLAQVYKPSVIIELGTNYGLSLRRWREAAPTTPVVCVDACFDPLRQSQTVLPVDMTGVTLIEKMVHDVDLKKLWLPADQNPERGAGTKQDVVLLYVDVHSDHEHIFEAVKQLPHASIIVFDDVWRTSRPLATKAEKDEFFKAVVFPEVDQTAPMEIMPLCYADYWRCGGFWGFDEVPKICDWTRANKIQLHWEAGAKVVWAQWPQDFNFKH